MDPSFFHQDPRKQPPPPPNHDVEDEKKPDFPVPQAAPPPSGHQEGPPASASISVSVPVPTNSESATDKPTGISPMELQAQKHDEEGSSSNSGSGSSEEVSDHNMQFPPSTFLTFPVNDSVANHSGIAGPAVNAPVINHVDPPHDGDQKSSPRPEKKQDEDMADTTAPAIALAPVLAPPLVGVSANG